MILPDTPSEMKDPKHNVTYRFLAYRKLTYAEMVMGIQQYLSQPRVRRRKTRERNQVITIVTIYGGTSSF